MILADFHMHSQYSDGKMKLPELVDFYGQRGFGAIAITDHLCEEKSFLGKAAAYLNKTLTPENFQQYIEDIQEQTERAMHLYKMVVIPGFEITKNSLQNHRSAHILALGVENYIRADLEIHSLIDEIHHHGGIAIAAHPISRNKIRGGNYFLWDRRDELAHKFDAWEMTDNGQLLPEVVKTKLPKLATSDLHKASQLTGWKTSLTCERHPQAILTAIAKQQIDFKFYQDNEQQTSAA